LVEAICRIGKEKGARRIIIGEGSAIGYDTEKAFDETGLRQIAKHVRAELFDFKRSEWIPVSVPRGIVFHRIKLPRILMEADVVVNVPVMKTHDVFPATLGLKNMKGVIRERDKKRFHKWGLAQAIADLNKVALPDLTIIDGTVGMEGLGPIHGVPANLGVLIASRDIVAADTVAATLMGIAPMGIDYLKLASEQHLGCGDVSLIEIVGENLNELIRPFKRAKLDIDKYKREGICIYEKGACSGCRHTLEAVIIDLGKQQRLDILRGYHIVFGQSVGIPNKVEGKLVRIGTCAKRCEGKGSYIPGCPPHPIDIVSFFQQKKNKE